MAAVNFLLEQILPGLRGQTIGSNLTIDLSGSTLTLPSTQTITNPTLSGATATGSSNIDFSGSTGAFKTSTGVNTFGGSSNSFTNAITPAGGIGQISSTFTMPTNYQTGYRAAPATTALTQKQIVTTETYFAELFIEGNSTITGVSVLNGHTTSGSMNLNVGLARADGTIVASSATTTAQTAADAFQQIPFSTTYAALGPAKYYIAVQGSATTGYITTHHIGNFGANKKTSETYGTFVTTASYSTTTFTADLGPVAETY